MDIVSFLIGTLTKTPRWAPHSNAKMEFIFSEIMIQWNSSVEEKKR